ncbi:MAG: NUDIX domain-containing protein [Turicibacter sp.]
MIEKTFGIKLENQIYLDRVGAYAIIFNEKSQVATVKTKKGNFLIGGGIETIETHEECIRRECFEETGFEVEILKFICKGELYDYSDSLHS